MSFGKVVRTFLLVAALALSGCASYARYTHDEIKDYPLDVQEKIIKGEIMPGMTPQQVRYAWGPPGSVRPLEPEGGKQREEWIYSTVAGVFKTRLTFIDGKLVYIISSEPGRVK
ncbi:MAG: outer membrane protein assembly factor BamE [Nitrospirae bacterium]|nr:outer membrane protein assembly factor BamE [Nitrospirota bacterium]MCL5237784.1 outer membrane protein assembly factor BamE [Nitrospirota bacterium]